MTALDPSLADEFIPDERDRRGLEDLVFHARGASAGTTVVVSCFNAEEAAWIKRQMLRALPWLEGRLVMKWMTFPGR